jgi:phosphopantothenoylcysteine decarboxylase
MKNIILGVTGSVAAIKTLPLVQLLQRHFNVRVVITQRGEYFIKNDFAELDKLKVQIYRDHDEWPELNASYQVGEPILHIEMRRWADIFLLAPLDANTLAKISNGFCDNLLTSIVRAWDWNKPMILCPAMNTMMWDNPPTAEQLDILKRRGVIIIPPIEKKLACQDIGMGGMALVDDIVKLVATYA